MNHQNPQGRDFVRERMEHFGTVLGAVGALELWDLANEAGRRVLKLLPCPSHGECAPHATEQIEKMRAVVKAARTVVEEYDYTFAKQRVVTPLCFLGIVTLKAALQETR